MKKRLWAALLAASLLLAGCAAQGQSPPDSGGTNPDDSYTYRLYVNSWGRDKKQKNSSRVGVKASARFLCTAEEDSVPEIAEVTHPKADPF